MVRDDVHCILYMLQVDIGYIAYLSPVTYQMFLVEATRQLLIIEQAMYSCTETSGTFYCMLIAMNHEW